MAKQIFSIITPVFSVTRSFRNHSNILISCSIKFYYRSKWLLNIFFGNFGKFSSGLFDRQTAHKNNIYFK